MAQHTSKEFENELTRLRERLIEMGARGESQLAAAMRALEESNDALAREVVSQDNLIDQAELDVDELALTILATRQPVASDLRFIAAALKFVTDLERIGDLAANIAKRALELNQLPAAQPPVDFSRLYEQVSKSLREALDSFVRRDADLAAQVIEGDLEIDRRNAALFGELLARVASEPSSAGRIIPLTSVARSLERIGDHAKNIAEQVVYMVRGRDVRHRGARVR